ncbi:protein phosphatase 1 regulatory subunit 1C-like isoform X4 [Anguilla rostrata]|uniref:protein phosphatase 1 regulatory subunit 1C-like isoform X4 n=1 Tax=Anguilla rostrata TaxID=7938 RepID=UPI0030D2DC06
MEPNSPKKIQFSVPLFQSQLDPQAAEHIRRRRPTPATLVFYSDPPASAEDRKRMSGQTENAELLPAQRKQAVHTPPTMKGDFGLRGADAPAEETNCEDHLPHVFLKHTGNSNSNTSASARLMTAFTNDHSGRFSFHFYAKKGRIIVFSLHLSREG